MASSMLSRTERSPLKGKLEDLEMRDANLGAVLSKGVFGEIVEVTVAGKMLCGQKLRKELLDSKKSVFGKFPTECRRLCRLNHPNVVKLFGVFLEENSLLPVLIVQRDRDMSTLTEHLRQQPEDLVPSKQLRILRDVASGLQYLHGLPSPVFHRFLTPDNIILAPGTHQAKIYNAGVGELLDISPSRCRSRKIPGVESFLPPETPPGESDPAVDVFSYGVLIIHTILQEPEQVCPPVFIQDQHNPSKLVMDIFSAVGRIVAQTPNVPNKALESHPLYGIVQKCFMKSSAKRPAITDIIQELDSCQENIIPGMEAWEADLQAKIEAWFKESNSLTLTVIGKTGTGKSSLVNGLVGKKVRKEGATLDPATAKVEPLTTEIEGVSVKMWDTPGLQDAYSRDEHYLKMIQESGCMHSHLKLYCISLRNARFEQSEVNAIRLITEKFGSKVWEHCMFVLTFANMALGLCPLREDPKKWLGRLIEDWKVHIQRELRDAGVDEDIVTSIVIIPTGYHQATHTNPKPWKLPGIPHWFHAFWYACASVLDHSALPALIKANRRRFKKNITAEDIKADIENQPIPIPPAFGGGSFFATLGFGAGVLVGAICGIGGGPLGIVIGAITGAGAGTGAGVLLSIARKAISFFF